MNERCVKSAPPSVTDLRGRMRPAHQPPHSAHSARPRTRSAQPRIKHVVVLFEENRSRDHRHHTNLHADGLKATRATPFSSPTRRRATSPCSMAHRTCRPRIRSTAICYQHKFDISTAHQKWTALSTRSARWVPEWQAAYKHLMQGFSQGALPVSARWLPSTPSSTAGMAFPPISTTRCRISATANGGTNTGDGYHCKKGAVIRSAIPSTTCRRWLEYTRIFNDDRRLAMESFNSDAAKNRTQRIASSMTPPRRRCRRSRGSARARHQQDAGNLGGLNSDHPDCCDVALGSGCARHYEALRAGAAERDGLRDDMGRSGRLL